MRLRNLVTSLLALLCGIESAAALSPPFNVVHSIAAPTTGVPQEFDFDISTAGTYTVTLTDLGAALTPPAPLASVKMAVTSGDKLVGTPQVGAGTLTLSSLAAGTYTLHVIGMPGNVAGSGPFGIQVEDTGMTQIAAFQGTLALPSQALPNGEGVLDASFQVSTTGPYVVTLADLQLPQPLTTLTLLLIAQGGQTPLTILPDNGALTATVTLTAGVTYDVFAVGQAAAAANAGLFAATVAVTAGGPPVFGRAVPVGGTSLVGTPALAAGSDNLTLTDLKYPAPLSQLGSVLTLAGQPVARLTAAGTQAFTATTGTYSLFAIGTPSAGSTAGSYAAQILPSSGQSLFAAARGVTAPGGTLSAYAFDTSIPAAGTYTAALTDFQFPSTLSSLSLGAVQGAALVGTPLTAGGTLDMNAAAGPLSLLVFAQAAGGTAGLFGITVNPPTGNSVFDVTQAVGALFSAQQFTIANGGSYSVTTSDLGFPASFANYDTIVTHGAQQVGSIFGGGTFNFSASPGNYFLNFIAQPAGSDQAGTYALSVATAPSPPAVTLSTDHTQVNSGSTVDLIWSSQNATTCVASGGWTGPQALSGTVTSAPLTSTTTFTLTCAGPGGSTPKSATVTVSATSSGGGGGAIDFELLAVLAGMRLMTWRLRRG